MSEIRKTNLNIASTLSDVEDISILNEISEKILIVDDDSISRTLLRNILKDRFSFLEAENGLKALRVLSNNKDISIILLDLDMPVMSGYEFMETVRKNSSLMGIPIIITTSSKTEADEIRSLEGGAIDFITKPYNPEIVRHRVNSIIHLRETSAMVNILAHDQLTGVYSRESFYYQATQKINFNPEKHFSIICSDIRGFKVLNETYGIGRSDSLLQCIANILKVYHGKQQLCGRLGSDTFALLVEYTEHLKESFFDDFFMLIEKQSPVPNVEIKFGVYEDIDRSQSLVRLCSRSLLALEQIKNDSLKRIGFFVQWKQKQQFLNDFDTALKEKQFQMYLQPKFDIERNIIAGAESLVRWNHPTRGFVYPNDFIPLFEEHGCITRLDFYMWEEACIFLHNWKEKGHDFFPVSVNMSRLDINTPDLVERILMLVKKYDIPEDMLHFEVLERAYTENAEKLIEICSQLRMLGFKIEMDDFGTGNSSLNMLNILPIDYLKLDMTFLHSEEKSLRKSILPSIVSLAKWLDLEIIAEGVEKESQVERLRNIGCHLIQGYYFSRPLNVDEFELYSLANAKSKKPEPISIVNTMDKEFCKKFFSQKRCTTLVVEDVDITRDILCKMLDPFFNVFSVSSGLEALSYLNENAASVDFVMLDLMLPGLNGFQIIESLRKNKKLCNIPIIVTSEAGRDSEFQAIKNGADGFIAKPYRIELVLHYVRLILMAKGVLKNE